MRLSKKALKKIIRKAAPAIIDRIEKYPINEGVFLNVFNSGKLLNVSKIAEKAREIAVKEARKALGKL